MSFFEKLKDATIGFSGYARLARDPRGGFGYMAILLAIVLAINCYINMVAFGRAAQSWSSQVAAMPPFGIRQGQFYFEGTMPYRERLDDGTLLVIDTTGQTQPESLAGQSTILVTRDHYFLIQPGSPVRQGAFSMLRQEITKESLQELLASRPERVLSFLYIFVYLFQLIFKAIDAAILGGIALFYASRFQRRIPFALGFKLGIYAMTLPTIIQWVINDFHTYTTVGFTLWWSMATIYLIFGLRAYLIQTHGEEPTLR